MESLEDALKDMSGGGDDYTLINQRDDMARQRTVKVSKEFVEAPNSLVAAAMIAGLCNNSSVIQDDEKGWTPVGDPTEVMVENIFNSKFIFQ